MTQERIDSPAAKSSAKGPGQVLRQARLDLRLAPEDVAQMLKLAPRQILALEEDDFASLPGPTYVRGYLRGYAQLLGLKPEPVVEAFNRLSASAPKVDLAKLAPEPQLRSDHHVVRFVSIGVVIVIFGLALAWWYGRSERPAPAPVALGPTAPAGEAPVLPTDSEKGGDAASAPIPPPTLVPAPMETEQKTAPATVATTAAPVQRPPSASAPVVPAPSPSPVARDPAPAQAPTPATAGGPRVKLVLVTTQDSWAEVRDGKQNKLLYETVAAGRTVVLEGAAPLSVFLGNVEGVGVEFNGKPYDTAPHRRGPIARFTLGEPNPGVGASNVPQ